MTEKIRSIAMQCFVGYSPSDLSTANIYIPGAVAITFALFDAWPITQIFGWFWGAASFINILLVFLLLRHVLIAITRYDQWKNSTWGGGFEFFIAMLLIMSTAAWWATCGIEWGWLPFFMADPSVDILPSGMRLASCACFFARLTE